MHRKIRQSGRFAKKIMIDIWHFILKYIGYASLWVFWSCMVALTAPPCPEGMNWIKIVLVVPVSLATGALLSIFTVWCTPTIITETMDVLNGWKDSIERRWEEAR